ncbi:hypothetical protein ABHN03_16850 [Paenibacillus sp. NRS-1775]|uniref:hypothetical protein n=1 Tax=unclassified Paenibacillus TaxID=185978 RepID=UPI003D29C1DF
MLESIIKRYDNEKLKNALSELITLKETGILEDGVIRETHVRLIEVIPTHPFSITTIENAVLWEVVRRGSIYPSR